MSRRSPHSKGKASHSSVQGGRRRRPSSSGSASQGLRKQDSSVTSSHSLVNFPGTPSQIKGIKNCRVVAGLHSCRETLRCRPQDILQIWFKSSRPKGDLLDLLVMAQDLGIEAFASPLRSMEEFCQSHQGVILFVSSHPELIWSDLESLEEAQLLVVDGVVDPRNLGAMIRTAWLMGVSGILISSMRASPLTGAATKVACGGAEYVAVEVCDNLGESIKALKERGFWVYGLASEARGELWKSSLAEKVVWVMGSENKGLRPGLRRLCDEILSIPQEEGSASYNVSVAAALAMGEFRRRYGKI